MNKTKIFLAISSVLMSGSALAVCSASDYAAAGHTYDGVTVWSNGGAVGVGDNYGDCIKITTSLPRIKDDGGWGGETNNTNGIYFAWVANAHGNMIFGDGLWATTKGNYSDVVKTNGGNDAFGGHTIVIGNDALLESEGLNASIINVAQSANSGSGYGKVIVGDNSQLLVKGTGTGVRVNLTSNVDKYNFAYIGKNAVITGNGDGNNTNDSIGYGVFAGNRDTVTHNGLNNGMAKGVNAIAVIDSGATISTSGQNAHAVYANKGGTIQLYGADISATGTGADAILAEQKSTADNNNSTLGGTVNIAGNISITKANDGYAMHTIGDNSIISSSVTNYYLGSEDKLYDGAGTVVNNDAKDTQNTAGVYSIEGNLFAESGLIDLRMIEDSAAGSTFIGYTKIGKDINSLEDGKINLSISGAKSYWKMTDNSELTELDLIDSALLDVSDNDLTLKGQVNNTSGIIKLAGTNNTKANSLIIDGNYAGGVNQPTEDNPTPLNNSSLIVNTVWNEDPATSYTDSLHITGSADGYTEVKTTDGIVGDIQSDKTNGTDKYSNSVVIVDSHAMGANSFYGFANTSGQEQAILVQKDDNNYAWKLSGSKTAPINPINPKVPEAVLMPKANLSAGYRLLGTFHERLSEQQAAENIGLAHEKGPVWGRLIGNYNSAEGQTQYDYKSKLLGFQFGYDFDTSYYEDNSVKSNFGAMFTYARDNLSFYNSKNVIFDKTSGNYAVENTNTGHGQSDIYSLGAYYTYYDQSNTYLDLVGMFNYIKNKYTTYNVSNDTNHAYGTILSAEVGKSFAITNNGLNDGDWFIEPQAQLSYQYLKYSSYNTTGNLLVDQNNQQGLRGRIGGRLAYNQGNDELGIKTVYFTGNIIHDFLNQKDINFGTSNVSEKNSKTAAELGFGIQLPLTNTSYLYADTRYYHSLDDSRGKTKEFSGTVGLKYFW